MLLSVIASTLIFVLVGIVGCGSRSGTEDDPVAEPDASLPSADASDPCDGVRCTESPEATCLTATTRRTFREPGICVAGRCEYEPTDTVCEAGCVDGGCECAPVPWTLSTVDPDGRLGSASVAVEPGGRAHLSYVDRSNALRYAYRDSAGSWVLDTVDREGTRDAPTSLAIDASGGLHLAYRRTGTDDTDQHYAYRAETGAWTSSSVERLGGDGVVAIDALGGVHMAYMSFSGWRLRYASLDTAGNWNMTPLTADNPRRWPSLAVDGSGVVHLAYVDSNDLRYARRDARGTWVASTVDTLSDPRMSLALDDTGGVHLAYEHQEATRSLRHAYRDPGGAWTITTVHTSDDDSYIGHDASIAVDRRGAVHISYTDRPPRNLLYAYRSREGDWERSIIEADSFIRGFTTLAVDHIGGIHIGYHDEQGMQYAYSRRCP